MMMGMQGLGKPGINMSSLCGGAPVDYEFYFPGYADGGISGELQWNGNAVNNYQRMPHVITVNPVRQLVPRQQFPEAILEGKATGYLWDGMATEIQFAPYSYPMPGYSPIHMIYKYGGSSFSTLTESNRMVAAYRHESIECVVNQSIWMEGEAQFADLILPACTNFERFDIGEWCAGGGYLQHGFDVVNHRVIALQHKCIEPLGESKSDYQIFTEILSRLGLGAMFTEGPSTAQKGLSTSTSQSTRSLSAVCLSATSFASRSFPNLQKCSLCSCPPAPGPRHRALRSGEVFRHRAARKTVELRPARPRLHRRWHR